MKYIKLILPIFIILPLFLLFGTKSVHAEYGRLHGEVYMWYDPGNGAPRVKIFLNNINMHRQVYVHGGSGSAFGNYCQNDSSTPIKKYKNPLISAGGYWACFQATAGLKTRTTAAGVYHYSDSSLDGCTWSGGNKGLPRGWMAQEAGCGGWRGLSCGNFVHRWTPYFPQGYNLDTSISNPMIRDKIDWDPADLFGGGHFEVIPSVSSGGGTSAVIKTKEQCRQLLPRYGAKGRLMLQGGFCNTVFPWVIRAPSTGWAGTADYQLGDGNTSANMFYILGAPPNSMDSWAFDFIWVPEWKQELPCGDGDCDSGENCDGNTRCQGNGVFTPGECRSPGDPNECTYCGDGVVQSGEECDDGNTVDTDTCTNDCRTYTQIPDQCGDECTTVGESCDDGSTCQQISDVGLRCVGNDYDQCTYSTHIENDCTCPEVTQDIGCGSECETVGESCDDGTACTLTSTGLRCAGSDYSAITCTETEYFDNSCECPPDTPECGDECDDDSDCPQGEDMICHPTQDVCVGDDYEDCEIQTHLDNDCTCPEETQDENPDFDAEKTAAIQCINNETEVQIDYTITVTNTSTVTGTILSVQDTYDSRFQSTWISNINPTPDSHTGNVITWNNGGSGYNIAASASLTFTYRVTMPMASSGETVNGTWVPYVFENFAIVRPEEGNDIELTTEASETCVQPGEVPPGELPPTGILDSVVTPVLGALLLITAGAILIRYQGGTRILFDTTSKMPFIQKIGERITFSKKERFEKKVVRRIEK